MRPSLLILALSAALLVLQSTTAVYASMHPVHPNLLLPIAISLGVAPEVALGRGAFLAFLLGCLVDSFSACPLGLQAFAFVSTFLLARLAGLRLFLRGPGFQVGLAGLIALAASVGVSGLRAIFEARDTAVALDWQAIAGSSLVTAALAPLVFQLVRRIETLQLERQETA